MTAFRTTYANGKTNITESSDCDTVEAFCNSHFGSAWEGAKEAGATVEIITPDEAEAAQRVVTVTTPEPEPEVLSGAEVVAEVTGEPVKETVTAKAVKAVKAAVKKVTPAKKAKK